MKLINQIKTFSFPKKIFIIVALFFLSNTQSFSQSSDFLDVTKAGVKSDGSENVVAKLTALLKTNKNLYFPAGKYQFDGQIDFSGNNYTFKGEDSSSTFFIQNKKYANIIIFQGNNCNFKNIGFVQTGFGDESKMFESYGSGVCIYRGNNNQIENCTFTNCGDFKDTKTKSDNGSTKSSAGVYISGGENNFVTNSKFVNCIMGVDVDDYRNFKIGDSRRFVLKNNNVKNNNFIDCFRSVVIDFGGADGGKDLVGGIISGNVFEKKRIGDKAILLALFNNSDSVIVENNVFKGRFNDAIGLINGCRNVRISNNNIDAAYSGITLYSKGFYNRKITVSGNTITNSVFSAVTLSSSGQVSIFNNTMSSNKTAISLTNFPDSVSIKNNHIDKILGTGISLGDVVNVEITDNKLFFNQGNASSLQGINIAGAIKTNIKISENQFSLNDSNNNQARTLSSPVANNKFMGVRIKSKDKARISGLDKMSSQNTFNGINSVSDVLKVQ